MLVLSPVELPTGVGAQFVKTTVERIVENKGACSLSVFQFYQMAFQHVALLIPELGVKQLAEVGELACVAAPDVSLEV